MKPNFRLLTKTYKRQLDNPCKYFSTKEEFPKTNEEVIKKHKRNVAQNYDPHPIAIVKGEGMYLFDVEGKKYLDCLAGYAAVSAGHCHPKIVKAIQKQLTRLIHPSRSVYIAHLANYGHYVCKLFNFEKMLPMNTGVEACETAIKCARKWGYEIKKIPENEAIFLLAIDNFFGRTITATSGSSNEFYRENFGPFLPGLKLIPYNDICAFEKEACNPKVCGFMVEPIQGEGGIVIPDEGYLRKVREISTRNKVLWISDEVQAGIGRTGRLLCCDHECVRPDIVTLGKALTAGTIPCSAVLSSAEILDVIKPGQHGSTYGGNAVACVAATSALEVLLEENLIENAEKMGTRILCNLKDLPRNIVKEVRGKGLMIGVEFCQDIQVEDVTREILKLGMITKPASGNVLRITPPLIITPELADEACKIIKKAIENMTKKC